MRRLETIGIDSQVRLRLTEAEHSLLLRLPFLAPALEDALYRAQVRGGIAEVSFMSGDLYELAGCVAFEADHAGDEKLKRQLRRLLRRLTDLAA